MPALFLYLVVGVYSAGPPIRNRDKLEQARGFRI